MTRYSGCIVSKLLKAKTYTGKPRNAEERNQVTFDEAKRMLPRMQGLKVCFNHDESVKIGQVLNARITADGSFDIDFEVDLQDSVIQDLVQHKVFKGLSLSHELHSCRPVEVSVCWEGARPGTTFSECKDNDYILEESNEVIIRASITEANRFFAVPNPATMNAAEVASPADAVLTPAASVQPDAALMTDAERTAEDEAAAEAMNAISKDTEGSVEDWARQLLGSAAVRRLFVAKTMTNDDKNEVKNHFLHLIESNHKSATENNKLKQALVEAEKQMEAYKQMTKHTNQSVIEAFKELGQEIDESKAAKLQRALEHPAVRESGLGEMIVQCSKNKQNQQMQQLQQQAQEKHAALSPSEKADLEMYKTMVSLLDKSSMSPQSLVQASTFRANKRAYNEMQTAVAAQQKRQVESLTGDAFLDSLLHEAPNSMDFKLQSNGGASKQARLL